MTPAPEFQLGLGQMRVDLTRRRLLGHDRAADTVTATMGAGELDLVVPDGVNVVVNAKARAGEIVATGPTVTGEGMRRLGPDQLEPRGRRTGAETVTFGDPHGHDGDRRRRRGRRGPDHDHDGERVMSTERPDERADDTTDDTTDEPPTHDTTNAPETSAMSQHDSTSGTPEFDDPLAAPTGDPGRPRDPARGRPGRDDGDAGGVHPGPAEPVPRRARDPGARRRRHRRGAAAAPAAAARSPTRRGRRRPARSSGTSRTHVPPSSRSARGRARRRSCSGC